MLQWYPAGAYSRPALHTRGCEATSVKQLWCVNQDAFWYNTLTDQLLPLALHTANVLSCLVLQLLLCFRGAAAIMQNRSSMLQVLLLWVVPALEWVKQHVELCAGAALVLQVPNRLLLRCGTVEMHRVSLR